MTFCHNKALNWSPGARPFLPAVGERCPPLNLESNEPNGEERYTPKEESQVAN